MLSGSRGDSTSVTKYPYVSPLPEAPSRLECYWYVDVSSRTETIGAPFESIMSAVNTSHPFSIPFSVFLPDCLCLCMSSWLPKAKIRGCLSPIPGGDSGEVSEYMGHAWVPTSLVSRYLSLLFSLPHHLLISSPTRSYARASPMPRASCIPESRRDLLRLILILETLPLRRCSVAPSYVLPLFLLF